MAEKGTPKINGLTAEAMRSDGNETTTKADRPMKDEVQRIHEQLLAAIRRRNGRPNPGKSPLR